MPQSPLTNAFIINDLGGVVVDEVKFKKPRNMVSVGEVKGVPVECYTHCNNLSKDSSYYFLHRAQRSVQMAQTANRLRAKLEAKKSAASR
jgi:hypothetical protein